jgi:ligand-binding sensor domain-containing protein/AraC-like DNA-binding protein
MGRQPHRRLKLLLLAGIIITLSVRPAFALNPDTPIRQYLVDHWTVSDGLPSNLIHSIAQTPDGYLWIATNKGLVRFDGIVFKRIPFAPQAEKRSFQIAVPEALYFDNNRTLWIGSSLGLTAYDFRTRQFKTYTTADGLTGDRIRRITKDIKGNLWLGFVSTYVNRFANRKFHAINNSHGLGGNIINAIIQDRNGAILVGTRNNGVFIYTGGRFNPYPVDGLDGFIINLLEDHKGALWISTNKGLLQKTGPSVQTYTATHGLSNSHTSDILEDPGQNLWIGTIEGLNRAKSQPGHRARFEHTLEPFIIISLFEDREGSLWVGTYKSGLFRLKDTRFTTINLPPAPGGKILFSMAQKKDKEILIGAADGILLRLKDNQTLEPVTIPGLTGTGITAIGEDADGSLWLGTNGQGVIHFRENSITRFTTRQGLAGDLVTAIFIDRQNRLWFGTFNGISLLPSPTGAIQSLTSRGGLSGKKVHTIYQDNRGSIWIAADRGITVLENGIIPTPGKGPALTHYLTGTPVTWIYEEPSPPNNDGPIFWFATPGTGLKRFSLKTQSVISYTAGSGMTTDFIYRFFEDRRGNFWFMSDSGILRISKTNLNRFAAGLTGRIDCTSFGLSEGLKNPEFNNPFSSHSAFKTREGELWFMNKKEISVINPDKININKVPPPLVIEAVTVDRHPLPLHTAGTVHHLKDTGALRFRFTAPTLLAPGKVTFQYKLAGYSDNWTLLPPGSTREAHFENLEPGTYTFKVIAGNAEGIWNNAGASFSFKLERSFTKTPLFKIIVLLFSGILGTAVVFVLYNAYKRKKNNENVKYKSSSLHPDFVRQCVKKLNHLMEEEKLYRDEDISLPFLAEKLSITHHQLSQVLNDGIKQKFFDYINVYRLEEAKKIMTDPEGKNMKIQSIAYDVGFKTLTSFYKTFKKHTGMTPGRYKNQAGLDGIDEKK